MTGKYDMQDVLKPTWVVWLRAPVRMNMQRRRKFFSVRAIASIYLFSILGRMSAIRLGALSDMVSSAGWWRLQTLNGPHVTKLGLVVSVCKNLMIRCRRLKIS